MVVVVGRGVGMDMDMGGWWLGVGVWWKSGRGSLKGQLWTGEAVGLEWVD